MKGVPTSATSRSKSGILGVCFCPSSPRGNRKWRAFYGRKLLGWYPSAEEANKARLDYELEHIGVREGRWLDYVNAGYPEDLIRKHRVGEYLCH